MAVFVLGQWQSMAVNGSVYVKPYVDQGLCKTPTTAKTLPLTATPSQKHCHWGVRNKEYFRVN